MFVSSALVVDEIRENEYGGVDLIGLREELYFDSPARSAGTIDFVYRTRCRTRRSGCSA